MKRKRKYWKQCPTQYAYRFAPTGALQSVMRLKMEKWIRSEKEEAKNLFYNDGSSDFASRFNKEHWANSLGGLEISKPLKYRD